MPRLDGEREPERLRVGAAALGMFAGVAIGLLLAWLGYAALGLAPSLLTLIFGGALAGLVTGLILPVEAILLVEAVAHFFFGLAAGFANIDLDEESPDSVSQGPRYLQLAALFGASLAVALGLMSVLG